MKTNSAKATAVAMIAFFLWGFSFLFSKIGLSIAHPFVMLSHRFTMAVICMAATMLISGNMLQLRGKPVAKLLLMGLCDPVIYFTGESFGILYTTTAFSGVMIATIPIFTLAAGWIFLHERASKSQIFWSVLSVAGVMVIAMQGSNEGSVSVKGVLFLLMAVTASTAYTALARALSAEFTPFERTFVSTAEGAVVFWILAAIECREAPIELIQPLTVGRYWIAIIVLAVVASVICYTALNYALGQLSLNRVNIGTNLVTVVSVFAGVVFLHEPFSWVSALCSAVIVMGIYGVQRTAAPVEKTHGKQ